MAYIKCSNPANPAYYPFLIPAERLQRMLDRLQQHWVTHGGFCDGCQGTDCSVMKSVLWDVARWSFNPDLSDETWFRAALTAYLEEYAQHLGSYD